jgi:hypothetical protein
MPADPKPRPHPISLKPYGWILVGLWTLVVAASLGWNLFQDRDEDLRVARQIALTNYERDVLYRRWAAAHGGVFLQVSPPNHAHPSPVPFARAGYRYALGPPPHPAQPGLHDPPGL